MIRKTPILFVSPRKAFWEKVVEVFIIRSSYEVISYQAVFEKIMESKIKNFLSNFRFVVVDDVPNDFIDPQDLFMGIKDLGKVFFSLQK